MSEDQSSETEESEQDVDESDFGAQSFDLRKSLVVGQDPRAALQSIGRIQREVAEAARPIRELQDSLESATQLLRDIQQTMGAVTQPYAGLQQAISTVQSTRAIAEAYNRRWESIRESLRRLRSQIQVAVEEQIALEMPREYDLVEPTPAAESTAESWVEHFIKDFEDVEDECSELVIDRIEDDLKNFRSEPNQSYAAIHIFTSMQDALLWWLCHQDDEISTKATDEIGFPKYGTDEKWDVLRKYYTAYSNVEGGDSGTFANYK